jgi:iron complex outermembrane receptor protein
VITAGEALRHQCKKLMMRAECGLSVLALRVQCYKNDPQIRGMIVSNWDKERLLRSTILAGFAAFSLAGTQALAQENTDEEDQDEQAEESRDRIVVTGSLLRRDEFSSSAPIQVITSETASLEGLLDTSEILQESSIAAGSTQINTQFGGFIVNGGPGVNTVSLRGLGAQRTLLLFNGRRFGPSGVEGRVGAVDLNTIPQSVVQRIEILKDGAGSIYGSDAVAGVINVITRTEIDDPEISFRTSAPFEGGGETYSIDGAWGHSFDRGFITLSGYYNRSERLQRADREYFSCPQNYWFDPQTGERLDRIEADPTSDNQGNFKCFNSGVVDAIDVFTAGGSRRLIVDPNFAANAGSDYFEGFRARGQTGFFTDASGATVGGDETDSDDPRLREQDILPETERFSIYLTGEYDLGFANAYGELLYNNRKTNQQRVRQFFPWSGNPVYNGGNGAFGTNAFLQGINEDFTNGSEFGPAFYARPIALIPFNTEVDIDYWYGVAGLNGQFGSSAGFLADWAWDVHVSHSISDGSYTRDTVDVRNVVDIFDPRSDIVHEFDGAGNIVCRRLSDGSSCPAINYFSTDFMAGNLTDEEYAFLFPTDTGNTEFTQTLFNATMTGEVFELPAGPVGLAVGVEYRRSEIDDQPGPLSFNNFQWGLTSAVNTQGTDELYEIFAETEIPIIAGQPFFEELSLSASGRVFDYDLYDVDSVYKLGLNWQIHPVLRARGTFGTSYRAPGLFELYLGNQTGFVGQGIDPCIDWGESLNDNLRANCAADGIPDDYAGLGSSALSISGGGAGFLQPETSEALTLGVIVTPTDLNLSIALDYFEIEVVDQVSQLGAGGILGGCYGQEPQFFDINQGFCSLFTRNRTPGNPAFLNIETIQNNFINVDQQKTTGLDITLRYEHEFDFGQLSYDLQGTWTFDDFINTFEGLAGFSRNEFNGTIGDPDFVAQSNLQFRRGDWTASWFTDFTSRMSNAQFFGFDDTSLVQGSTGVIEVRNKDFTEALFIHGASLRYRGSDWTVIGGVTNIFDEHPPAVTGRNGARLGNSSLAATQFDLRGRTAFLNVSKRF